MGREILDKPREGSDNGGLALGMLRLRDGKAVGNEIPGTLNSGGESEPKERDGKVGRDPKPELARLPEPLTEGVAVGKGRLNVSLTASVGTALLGMRTAATLLGSTTRSVDSV